MSSSSPTAQRGITLAEVLIGIAMVAILAGVALPSYRGMMLGSRQTTQINDFMSTLNLARSRAVKDNVLVRVCATTSLTVVLPACGPGGTTWESGWIVFSDRDGDGAIDVGTGACDAGLGEDCLFEVHDPYPGGATLRGTAAVASAIAYAPNAASTASGTFTFCDSRGSAYAAAVVVSPSGRPRTSRLRSDGTALACP